MSRNQWLAILLPLALMVSGVSCATRLGGDKQAPDDLTLHLPVVEFDGDVFVDFNTRSAQYEKLAVLPFKAAVELAGAAMSDIFTTEFLKTAKYDLIERGQIENVLKEQEYGLSGIIDDRMAVEVGRILGVQGVVVGTVSEYGFQKVKITRAPSIGLSVRMIDTTTGKIVWSITHSDIGSGNLSLSQHAEKVVENMVMALSAAWIDAGDPTAPGLPPPRQLAARGGVREIKLEWVPHTSKLVAGYEILRRGPTGPHYQLLTRIRNTREKKLAYTDKGLQDLSLYGYRVRTISKQGLVSEKFAETETITAGPPPVPTGLQAKSGGIRNVPLTWTPSSDRAVAGYIISREDPGSFPVIAGRVSGRETGSHVDRGEFGGPLKDGHTYKYRIIAYNTANVESSPSEPVEVITKPAPTPVTGLDAASGLARAVELTWRANPEDQQVAGYNVYASEDAEGSWKSACRVTEPSPTRFVHKMHDGDALKSGWTYYYRVAAFNVGNVEGEMSVPVSATTKPVPTAVRGVKTVSGLPRKVRLTWTKNPEPDIVSYKIYRSTGSDGRYISVGTANAASLRYEDDRLQDGEEYRYSLAAIDKDGLEGGRSASVSATTKPLPRAPRKVSCREVGGAIEVSWEANREKDIDKYVVYQHSFFGGRPVGEARQTRCVVTDVKPGGTYAFTVVAVDTDGLESPRSAVVRHTISKE